MLNDPQELLPYLTSHDFSSDEGRTEIQNFLLNKKFCMVGYVRVNDLYLYRFVNKIAPFTKKTAHGNYARVYVEDVFEYGDIGIDLDKSYEDLKIYIVRLTGSIEVTQGSLSNYNSSHLITTGLEYNPELFKGKIYYSDSVAV